MTLNKIMKGAAYLIDNCFVSALPSSTPLGAKHSKKVNTTLFESRFLNKR
jgi:hypothetical protein